MKGKMLGNGDACHSGRVLALNLDHTMLKGAGRPPSSVSGLLTSEDRGRMARPLEVEWEGAQGSGLASGFCSILILIPNQGTRDLMTVLQTPMILPRCLRELKR